MVDPLCDDLARAFLGDEPVDICTEANVARLAQAIQTAIEHELVAIHEDHVAAWDRRDPGEEG
jgi:hypothetical protein